MPEGIVIGEKVEGRKSRATKFEEDVISFLNRLGFENVNGTDSFLVNGVQVDACGGHEDTLIVVECTMATEVKLKSLRTKIKEFRGVVNTLRKGFEQHPTYSKYKDIRFVVATKNIQTRTHDIEFANQDDPRVYIWDNNFREYYDDLFKKIGKYSKFNLLGEMHIRPIEESGIFVPAFLTLIGGVKMYSFVINPRDLLEVAFVARRETKNERYYQRIINKDRISNIAKYVNSGSFFPNNLVIAFGEHIKKHIHFHSETKNLNMDQWPYIGIEFGVLEFPRDYRSCWIIDGQHRLYSFIESQRVFNVPVVALDNATLEQQGKFFLDINKNQKPVPADLVWDLNGDMIPSLEDGKISNTVKLLNSDLESPLHNMIYIPSTGIKQRQHLLKLSGICLALKRLRLVRENTKSKTANPSFDNDPNVAIAKLETALSEFFALSREIFSEDWKLENKGFILDDGGNSVMIRIFEKILSCCVLKGKQKPEKNDYKFYLSPLKEFISKQYFSPEALKKLKLRITSEGGKDEVTKEFIMEIRKATGDQSFGGNIESFSSDNFRELEKKLKELINTYLSKGDENWFEKFAEKDKSLYERAVRNAKKYGETDLKKFYLHISFGECIKIMRDFRQLFYPIFFNDVHGFHKDDFGALEAAFNHLIRMRTIVAAHSIGVATKTHDEKQMEIYLDKVNKCIDLCLPQLKAK